MSSVRVCQSSNSGVAVETGALLVATEAKVVLRIHIQPDGGAGTRRSACRKAYIQDHERQKSLIANKARSTVSVELYLRIQPETQNSASFGDFATRTLFPAHARPTAFES